MWVFRYARFVRVEDMVKKWPKAIRIAASVCLWPLQAAQYVVLAFVLFALFIIGLQLYLTVGQLGRAVLRATVNSTEPSRPNKGGTVRQAGWIKKNSATRQRESKKYDDLRRRLKKLRSTGTGNPARRSPITGGQYGKQ